MGKNFYAFLILEKGTFKNVYFVAKDKKSAKKDLKFKFTNWKIKRLKEIKENV